MDDVCIKKELVECSGFEYRGIGTTKFILPWLLTPRVHASNEIIWRRSIIRSGEKTAAAATIAL